jgi:predicted permease
MIEKKIKPSRVGHWLLCLVLSKTEHFTLIGDFEEIYTGIAKERGVFYASIWYWGQIVRSIPSFLSNSTYWSLQMFKNYLKIALRNIKRHKGYSFINITGLAIGLACCLLITIWVLDELSYDRFHENASDLYRVEENQYYSSGVYHVNVTPYPLAPALKKDIPEIIEATRYIWSRNILIRYGEKSFFEDDICFVDPSFFHMFTFPFIKGDRNTALNDPDSIVITEKMAEKYFSGEESIGKVLSLSNKYDFKITGITKNVPHNSYLRFNMVIPYEFLRKIGRTDENMGRNAILTFVQLPKNMPVQQVNDKIRGFIKKHVPASRTELELAPYTGIHLHEFFGYGKEMGAIKYVYIFSVIALFVLLIACINFMTLSTARSANRAKEVGLRKVVGAVKGHIIRQFYGESVIYAFIALVFAIIIVVLLFPAFNNLSGKELTLADSLNWSILISLISITLFTGLVAGSYPALFLSAFQPVKVLKGTHKSGAASSVFRRILVVIQFALSVFLIIGTAVVYSQLNYMKNREIGYDKEHLVYLLMRGETRKSYSSLKNELLKDPRILGVTASSESPSNIGSNSAGAEWDGKDPEQSVLIGMNSVDFDFIETLRIELKEGRGFSKDFKTDETEAFIINEEVAKFMGKESIVGENFSFVGREGKIIGVMKNFHYQSIRNKIEPLAIYIGSPENLYFTLIRIPPESIPASLSFIEDTWQKINPSYPFEYRFLDEDFDRYYRAEERMGGLLKYFSILAVFIACLGLFGLASFTAEQRTKEIGIRKVLGARVSQITILLCKEFLMLVLLANVIAWPVAYFVMRGWLQNYAYRTSLGLLVFAAAMVTALIVAIISVSFQAIRAAVANPADSLRYE